jgi:hypothetical protein
MTDQAAAALKSFLVHQSEMQRLVVRYLTHGLTEQQFIGEIIEMLDGRVQRERTKLSQDALSAGS